MIPDRFRQTGRTTRMLASALLFARAGGHGVIVAGSEREADRLLLDVTNSPDLLSWEPPRRVLRFSGGGTLRVISWDHPDFSWEDLRLRGDDPRARVFLDHYASEMHTRAKRAP